VQILSVTVDLEAIAKIDPDIAAVAGALGFGMGIKVNLQAPHCCVACGAVRVCPKWLAHPDLLMGSGCAPAALLLTGGARICNCREGWPEKF
jgi:hypothetical protein